MVKLFKPGDKVELKTGGPVMQVIKYVAEEHPVLGMYESNYKVQCVWYDPEFGRKTDIFHQNSLTKASWVKSNTMAQSRKYSGSTLYGLFKNIMQDVPAKEAVTSVETLVEAIAYLNQQGYKKEFIALAEGLKDLESKEVYPPDKISIEKVFRFEGYSDIDDMSVLYAITCDDGTKGWIADAYGTYANPDLSDLLMKMKDKQTQKKKQEMDLEQ